MIEYENLRKLNQPFVDRYKQAFSDVLETGWYILGNQVGGFELEFGAYLSPDEPVNVVGVATGQNSTPRRLAPLKSPNQALSGSASGGPGSPRVKASLPFTGKSNKVSNRNTSSRWAPPSWRTNRGRRATI